MVRMAKNEPSEISVNGFQKLAIDSLTNLKIIAFHESLNTLSSKVKEQIKNLEIEFFDRETILRQLKENNISKVNIQNYPIYDMIGPPLLAQELPEVALQKIPVSMKEIVKKLDLAAWQLFEDSVFSIFHYCFNYNTKKLGGERLFEHEPEGVVTVGDINRFALLYECKSAKTAYTMTSDHELRYKDYIKHKVKTVQTLYGATLKYFVIIAPAFLGDLSERRQKIFEETQVLTIFIPASVLSLFASWACKIPSDIKELIDLKSIMSLNEIVVSELTVTNYIKTFEDQNKSRW